MDKEDKSNMDELISLFSHYSVEWMEGAHEELSALRKTENFNENYSKIKELKSSIEKISESCESCIDNSALISGFLFLLYENIENDETFYILEKLISRKLKNKCNP